MHASAGRTESCSSSGDVNPALTRLSACRLWLVKANYLIRSLLDIFMNLLRRQPFHMEILLSLVTTRFSVFVHVYITVFIKQTTNVLPGEFSRSYLRKYEYFNGEGRRVPKRYSSCSCCWLLNAQRNETLHTNTFVLIFPTDLPSQTFKLICN